MWGQVKMGLPKMASVKIRGFMFNKYAIIAM